MEKKKRNLRTIALAQMYKMWEETERHVQLKKNKKNNGHWDEA